MLEGWLAQTISLLRFSCAPLPDIMARKPKDSSSSDSHIFNSLFHGSHPEMPPIKRRVQITYLCGKLQRCCWSLIAKDEHPLAMGRVSGYSHTSCNVYSHLIVRGCNLLVPSTAPEVLATDALGSFFHIPNMLG